MSETELLERVESVYPGEKDNEDSLKNLEGAKFALQYPNGHAAAFALLNTLKSGDEIIIPNDFSKYLSELVNKIFGKFNVGLIKADLTEPDKLLDIISEKTRFIWLESPSIPGSRVYDIERISRISRLFGTKIVVDNSYNTFINQKPLFIHADISLYTNCSLIKGFETSGLIFHNSETLQEDLVFSRQLFESESQPFPAEVDIKSIREDMFKRNENALRLAEFLQNSNKVARVYYSGIQSHPNYELAKKQQLHHGNYLSFYFNDDTIDAAENFIKNVRCLRREDENKTRIYQPASTTYSDLPAFARRRAGIRDSLVIVHAGTEKTDKLLEDIDIALSDHR